MQKAEDRIPMSKTDSNKQSFIDLAYRWTEQTTTEEVRDAYNQWATSYDEDLLQDLDYVMPARAAAAIAAAIKELIAATAPGKSRVSVLDIGCGTGLSGVELKRVGFRHIDGCDISTEMLKRAQARNLYGRLFEANLVDPPIDVATNAYDAATAVGVFSHGHLDVNATEEVIRVVKPGAPVVMTTNDHFEEDGKMQTKLHELEERGVIKNLVCEHGEHLKAKNIGGWVFKMEKTRDE